MTCLQFRKMPQKQGAVPVIRTDRDCYEEVMIDLEGPSNPADKNGCKYTMTYICCLCYGILIEPGARLVATETRRMFACCVMRSGTIPSLLRSDRGPELKNALMAEYGALIGLNHRFGTPWRPVEQGLVESTHRETQKIIGMLENDIMQYFPNETGALLHIVEFIIYNTPGPHGYTPRDAVNQFEPLSDYVKTLFRNYR